MGDDSGSGGYLRETETLESWVVKVVDEIKCPDWVEHWESNHKDILSFKDYGSYVIHQGWDVNKVYTPKTLKKRLFHRSRSIDGELLEWDRFDVEFCRLCGYVFKKSQRHVK